MIKPVWKAALGALAMFVGVSATPALATPHGAAAPLGAHGIDGSERARPLGAAPAAGETIQIRRDGERHDWNRRWDRPRWWREGHRAQRRVWRDGRLYAPRHVTRRGRALAPRYYRRKLHGPRFRYRHGAYRYFYSGWWYAAPWWLVVNNRYPANAYVVYDYPVELDYDDAYDDYDDYDRSYRRRTYRSGDRCGYWSDRCIQNWGYQNPNYYGCLRYHGCD